jgi:hypothetical protein
MRHRDRAQFGRMDKLLVATAGTLQAPTIGLQQLDQFATLLRVYYTHRPMSWPMTALRLSEESNVCPKVADCRPL